PARRRHGGPVRAGRPVRGRGGHAAAGPELPAGGLLGPGRHPAVAAGAGQHRRATARARGTGGGLGRHGQPGRGAARRGPAGGGRQGGTAMSATRRGGGQQPGRLESLARQVQRFGPGPMLVRGALFFAALVAEVVAWPVEVTFASSGLVLVLAAAVTMLAP